MSIPFRARPLALFVCYGLSAALAGGVALPSFAEGLSPLRVDPVLLGLPPAELPRPAPVRADVPAVPTGDESVSAAPAASAARAPAAPRTPPVAPAAVSRPSRSSASAVRGSDEASEVAVRPPRPAPEAVAPVAARAADSANTGASVAASSASSATTAPAASAVDADGAATAATTSVATTSSPAATVTDRSDTSPSPAPAVAPPARTADPAGNGGVAATVVPLVAPAAGDTPRRASAGLPTLRVDPALLGNASDVLPTPAVAAAPPRRPPVSGGDALSSRSSAPAAAGAVGAARPVSELPVARSASPVAANAPLGAASAVTRGTAPAAKQPWYERIWSPVQNIWEVGSPEIYLPFHTYHLRQFYTSEQIARYQEKPFGLGVGRGLYNEKGDWEGLYTMGFQDSHFMPQWMAGYAWKTFWRPTEDLRLGLGYTAFLMMRADVFHYIPFPGILPLASIGYKNLSLETAYVPGGKGNGNIFFFWAKWELGKEGVPIGTPTPQSVPAPQEVLRQEPVTGPFVSNNRAPSSILDSEYAFLLPRSAPAAASAAASLSSSSSVPAATSSQVPRVASSSGAVAGDPRVSAVAGSGAPAGVVDALAPLVTSANTEREDETTVDALPPLALRASRRMTPLSANDDPHPVFITGERLYGQTDTEAIAEGDAELRKIGTVINADTLTYWPVEDELDAVGSVRLEQGSDVVTGPHLRLRLQDQVGYFDKAAYTLKRQPPPVAIPFGQGASAYAPSNPDADADAEWEQTASKASGANAFGATGNSPLVAGALSLPGATLTTSAATRTVPRLAVEGRGEATRIDFEGKNQVRITDGTYTTCKPGNNDWFARASDMKLDYDHSEAEGHDGVVYFKDVPILYSPWLSFPLNNQRKSGFLAPTFGSTSQSGLDFTVPYYWNIAPNYDATLSPRILSKRGMQLNTEVRYLNPGYVGTVQLEMLPNDKVRNENRYGLTLQHTQTLAPGLTGAINYNRVSDDNYYTDLSSRIANTSQTQLLRQGQLSWAPSGWWNTTFNVQSYQTLQPDPTVAVARPYNLLPQITFNARKPDWYNTDSSLFGQVTSFTTTDTSKAEGRRVVVYPQMALPIVNSAWYVTPKLGLHATNWSLSRQDASALPGAANSYSRTLPVFSVDAGMTFERPLELFGKGFTQTLEPRLYYLNVPYQDQSKIPVFDSGLADFNFAQIFAENQFTGQDRFNDANQLTAAVSSRLIAPESGREIMRAMVGQRFYFRDQQVVLPDQTQRVWSKSDLLAAFSGEVAPKVYADTALQYNVDAARTERLNLGARYLPEPGKVFNATYRFNRDQVKQVDFSGQWPLHGGWYAVGRVNYSLQDKQPIENIAGFEYNGGCWVVRFVGQRLATTSGTSSTALFVQLELNDFSSIGSNPLDLLKRSIQGYGIINQPTANPVFGQ
ncbi:LPS assembly protein LptD [Rhodocyclus tenuis]|uniref:LPS-assembly protein LptD n=1 Tax=Rhodocyclus tenuis TaxID=1066 RepID=A0A6L5JVT5_RHOTE|nr:lipid IV(A) palmitoyltransferase PagP [Rhodocyclus gracilis]MQY51487.1 LPS assembly protein LptD [Rhodocyclus gracilis]